MTQYQETFTIRTAETGPAGKARLSTLCHLLQEAAGNHAEQLGFGMSKLRKSGRAWVLHRLQLEIGRYPRRSREVTVRTWPSGGDGIRAWRDFEMKSEEEEILLQGLSHWLMIDLERRRPMRIPEEIMRYAREKEDHVLPLPDGGLPPLPADGAGGKRFFVRRSDLDLNGHVNNVRYLEWMQEAVGEGMPVRRVDVEFHAECRYGERVRAVAAAAGDGRHMAEIRRQGEEKPVTRALFERRYRKR